MPPCYVCKGPTSPAKLSRIGENNRGWPKNELVCSACYHRRLTQVVSTLPTREAEVTMSEGKPIFSLNVFEIDPKDEGQEKDYQIVVTARVGGMSLEFDRTVDDVRNFFTERREKSEQRRLKSLVGEERTGKKGRGLKSVD